MAWHASGRVPVVRSSLPSCRVSLLGWTITTRDFQSRFPLGNSPFFPFCVHSPLFTLLHEGHGHRTEPVAKLKRSHGAVTASTLRRALSDRSLILYYSLPLPVLLSLPFTDSPARRSAALYTHTFKSVIAETGGRHIKLYYSSDRHLGKMSH
jgi:hypothetical protein